MQFKSIFKKQSTSLSIEEKKIEKENITEEVEEVIELQKNEDGIHIPTINELYTEYKDVIEKAIELGKEGKFVLNPEYIILPITLRCNLRCIMCYLEKKDYYLTTEEAKQLLSVPGIQAATYGKVKTIELTCGEAFLNPELHSIVKELKSIYSDAEISTITNATVKIQGNAAEALKYIDRVGISVDGATKETYEFIRKGADFFNVIKNIQDIVKLKEDNKDKITIAFVAMTINIHELPKLVRLAYYLNITFLFVQRMEIRSENQKEIEQYQLNHMPKDEIQQIIDETKEEMTKLNRYVTFTELIPEENQNNESQTEQDKPSNSEPDEIPMRMCKYLWKTSPYMWRDEIGLFPNTLCCHMPDLQSASFGDVDKYRNKSLFDIYNSSLYWDNRMDMLNGKLLHTACKGCQYYKFYSWSKDELEELKNTVNFVY